MSVQGNRASVVRFLLDGEVQTLENIEPTRTVLQVLREDLGRCGTKEGCAEGDCGACTVVLVERHEGGLRYRAVNSCIQFAPTLDGKALVTVESLQGPGGTLHPVQQAMADCHASQCGFCTPGFVMSLFAMYKTEAAPSREAINDGLAGNLCRCTGYRPIVDAARVMFDLGAGIPASRRDWMCAPAGLDSAAARRSEAELSERLAEIASSGPLALQHERGSFYAPRTLEEFATLREGLPDARVLAGGTDVGLWVTKQYRELGDILYLGNVAELRNITTTATHLDIGAAVTLSDVYPVLAKHYPELETIFRRFASPPIRNAGTLAGNVANGSPIGDAMPCLIALGATVVLQKGAATRELPMEALYLAYQKTAMEPGEFVARVRVPLPRRGDVFRAWKISKRVDQDISAVCAAFLLSLDAGRIVSARIAFGGMAATPKRASRCEAALAGHEWNEAALASAIAALAADYQPIDDMRASAAYRMKVAQNLLRKLWLETASTAPMTLTRLDQLKGAAA